MTQTSQVPALQKQQALAKPVPVPTEWQQAIDTVKAMCGADATDADFKVFCYHAQKAGLDPLAKQIYLVTRNSKVMNKKTGQWEWVKKATIQASIDGMRLVAQRSGVYAGQVGPEWCGEDGVWKDVWLSSKPPAAARVGVLRTDFAAPCYGVARFDAYAQTDRDGKMTGLWPKMGEVMIAKCAEMLALRKAFPQELSGIYGKEEMEQADNADRLADKREAAQAMAGQVEQHQQRMQSLQAPAKPEGYHPDLNDGPVAGFEAGKATLDAQFEVLEGTKATPVEAAQAPAGHPADEMLEGVADQRPPEDVAAAAAAKGGMAEAFAYGVKIQACKTVAELTKLGKEIAEKPEDVKAGIRDTYMKKKAELDKAAKGGSNG